MAIMPSSSRIAAAIVWKSAIDPKARDEWRQGSMSEFNRAI
jgi:hypothetical protein